MRSFLLSLLSASFLCGAAMAREVSSQPAAATDFANVEIYAANIDATSPDLEMLGRKGNAQVSMGKVEPTFVARTSSPNRTW